MRDPVDPIAAADPWSRTVAYLTMLFNDEQLATGTGILALHPNGQAFLVTALHNLTGREPITNRVKSRSGGVPNRIRVETYFTNLELNLYDSGNDVNSGRPFFRIHRLGSRVDVTVLPVPVSVDATARLDSS